MHNIYNSLLTVPYYIIDFVFIKRSKNNNYRTYIRHSCQQLGHGTCVNTFRKFFIFK